MAAYASVVSLMTLIEQIQNHPCPPITLDKGQVESLCQRLTFLQEFLEAYPHKAIEEAAAHGLESRIADVGYAAADVIESHIADQIRSGSTSHGAEIEQFHQDLQKVILDMDLVTREVMEIKERIGNQENQLNRHLLVRDGWRRPPLVALKNVMVGFEDVFNQVLDKLSGYLSSRQIFPIVGMGGIGKTTLVRNVYECQFVVRHFDVRSWVVSSRDYNVQDILLKLLPSQNEKENGAQLNEQELGHELYKCLYDRRYLVVIDDVWSVDLWNEIGHFLPDNNNGSRVMITTRQSFVASELSKDKIEMEFLDDHKSWNLFCNVVFGEEACPTELEESGRKIAKDCKGLLLSIVVIGGLLAKSKHTQEDWLLVAKKLNSSMNLEHEEHCLQVLYTSYEHLPIHLKSCFLYMGVFPEDKGIKRSILIKLWVAEGFVKSICGKTLELVAEEYLIDLIDRNLVSVKHTGSTGRISVCVVHDVIRYLCIREAEKERFLCVAKKHDVDTQQGLDEYRRIAIHQSMLKDKDLYQALDTLQSTSLHSMVCHLHQALPQFPSTLRILRFTNDDNLDITKFPSYVDDIFHIFSLRFLHFVSLWSSHKVFRPIRHISWNMHLPWNMQTLILIHHHLSQPLDIWNLYQLRHVKVGTFFLSDPLLVQDHILVLQNLQSLSYVVNLRFGEEVVKRISNIKKLKLKYGVSLEECSQYCLSNLHRLQKLESLSCSFPFWSLNRSGSNKNITFPHSLIKLELMGATLFWEDVTTKIGALPHLQVLKLEGGIRGSEWNLVEGKFQCLRFLKIKMLGRSKDLEYWRAEGIHFPCLEGLSLNFLMALKEIPSGIGDAPKLQSIELVFCSDTTVDSAQKILDEQAKFGNTGFKVIVTKRQDFIGKFIELRPSIQDEEEEHL